MTVKRLFLYLDNKLSLLTFNAVKRVSIRAISCVFLCCIAFNGVAQDQDITLPENAVYIDVRTWFEHKIDRIEGDARIHVSDIVERVAEQFPAKDTPIRLYCARGVRSSRAATRLKEQGYLDVQNLGGINDARKLRGLVQQE